MSETALSRSVPLKCKHCGVPHTARVWEIVDAAARPDLIEQLIDDVLYRVSCPHCSRYLGNAEAPLLLYMPGARNPLLDERPLAKQVAARYSCDFQEYAVQPDFRYHRRDYRGL